MNVVNDVSHILFVCPSNKDSRIVLWEKVKECTPGPMFHNMSIMVLEDRTKFILNAFYSRYISQWKVTYDALSNFIYLVYNNYMETKSALM